MIYKIFTLLTFFLISTTSNEIRNTDPKLIASNAKSAFEMKAESIYNNLHSNNLAMPKSDCFKKALEGFYLLKEKGLIKRDILTLVDFSLSANTKRMWVIDLASNTILFNSLVAHGRNTGNEFADTFSNTADSFKSSLGFYATGETYNGKHGMSLKLDGLEKGVNDHARSRGVVVHGADYVSESFINAHHRLGRSQGCPALPIELTAGIINAIKDKSCLFIYHPSRGKKDFGLLS
ncbi:MAG TPA: murein L,D-transpeptidase catalytic domain family protein [Flavobacterium sp.]|nr:murein L,D-transpeptidase catalytic domain family protein [Flavobacterium sp.]